LGGQRVHRRFGFDAAGLLVVLQVDFVIGGVIASVAGVGEERFVRRLDCRGRSGETAAEDETEEEADSKRAQEGILR
jgi:hypothetical protein